MESAQSTCVDTSAKSTSECKSSPSTTVPILGFVDSMENPSGWNELMGVGAAGSTGSRTCMCVCMHGRREHGIRDAGEDDVAGRRCWRALPTTNCHS